VLLGFKQSIGGNTHCPLIDVKAINIKNGYKCKCGCSCGYLCEYPHLHLIENTLKRCQYDIQSIFDGIFHSNANSNNKYSSFIFYASFVLNFSFSFGLISALSLPYPTLNVFDILFISYDSAKTKK